MIFNIKKISIKNKVNFMLSKIKNYKKIINNWKINQKM